MEDEPRPSLPAPGPRGCAFARPSPKRAAGRSGGTECPCSFRSRGSFFRHVTNSEYTGIFAGINLAIHEGGHLFFMWFGSDFLSVAGGTLLQCLCPMVTGIMSYKQRDFFGIGVACFWLGTNFAHIAPYAAIGGAFRVAGIVTMGAGLSACSWVLKVMAEVNGAGRRPGSVEQSAPS